MSYTQMPRIERLAVSEMAIVIKFESVSEPIILKYMGKRDQKPYYESPNIVSLILDMDEEMAQNLLNSPSFALYAHFVEESTLHIARYAESGQGSLVPSYHLFIDLTKSEGGGFLPMKLEGGKLVPVQR